MSFVGFYLFFMCEKSRRCCCSFFCLGEVAEIDLSCTYSRFSFASSMLVGGPFRARLFFFPGVDG